MQTQVRIQKQQELVSILLNKHRYPRVPSHLDSFLIDIVLVVSIPTSPPKILRKNVFPLNFLRKKITPTLLDSYNAALDGVESDTVQDLQTSAFLNYTGGVARLESSPEDQLTGAFDITGTVLREAYEATPDKTVFMVQLNMLIYTLQRDCGFKVQKFILNDKIFILLQCKQENLMKAAVMHKIKKEVIYSEIDIYLNEPLDSKNRPLMANNVVKSQLRGTRTHRGQDNTQQRLVTTNYKAISKQQLKRYHRKLGGVQNYSNQIIDQVKLSQSEIDKYKMFLQEYLEILRPFDSSPCQQLLDFNEEQYIGRVLNTGKVNKGALKVFKEIKKKRRYFAQVEGLATKYGYDIFEPQAIYTQFFELNKRKKYFDKIRSLFMFKPLVVGPEGQLDLFLKMERTKLAYLILLEHFRLENFKMFHYEIFTLHNGFQKAGKTSKSTSIEGGLDGKNLLLSWSVFKPWKSDIKVIRDYLGQNIAYFTFLKNRLILDLMLFSPVALVAFLIIMLVLPLNLTSNGHLDSFVFYTVYAFTILAWFSAYTIRQDQEESFYFKTLRETTQRRTPNYGYESPYVRNMISDSVNEFREVKSVLNRVKQFLGLLFVVALLGIDIGIFYGLRSWALVLESQIGPSGLFFEWFSFIPIFLFFVGNHLAYTLVLRRLFKYITYLQNNPNLEKDHSSTEIKCLVFRIGVELIGPMDLMVVEALGSFNCYDSSCWNAYTSFINIRFIVNFVILLIRGIKFGVLYVNSKIRLRRQATRDLKHVQEGNQSESRVKKLFLKIIEQYSKRKCKVNIEEEILILVQIALFSVIQPVNIFVNLLTILLDFYLERIQIIHGARRPINSSASTPNYTMLMRTPFYIFCVFNSWMLLVNFEDFEYVSPQFYTDLVSTPSQDKLTTLKILLAFGLLCCMLLFQNLLRVLYENYSDYSEIIKRKDHKLKGHIHRYKKVKIGGSTCEYKPVLHIGRTYF